MYPFTPSSQLLNPSQNFHISTPGDNNPLYKNIKNEENVLTVKGGKGE